jgi:dynactin complex subunit
MFVGETKFGPGIWVGLEMEGKIGNHDGYVGGKRYFRYVIFPIVHSFSFISHLPLHQIKVHSLLHGQFLLPVREKP